MKNCMGMWGGGGGGEMGSELTNPQPFEGLWPLVH